LPGYLLRANPVIAYSLKAACAASAVHHAGGMTIVMAFKGRKTKFPSLLQGPQERRARVANNRIFNFLLCRVTKSEQNPVAVAALKAASHLPLYRDIDPSPANTGG
jgi:hypothetical protein